MMHHIKFTKLIVTLELEVATLFLVEEVTTIQGNKFLHYNKLFTLFGILPGAKKSTNYFQGG